MSTSLISASRSPFWLLHVGGWTAFTVAMMLGRIGERSVAEILILEPAFALPAALLTAALHLLYVRFGVESARLPVVFGVSVVASYMGSVGWTLCHHLFVLYVAPPVLVAIDPNSTYSPFIRHVLDGTVFHMVFLLAWHALYFGGQSYAQLQRERVRSLRAEASAHQARLQALRYQLNPHFLFNALNGISTLVAEVRTREASDMIAQLSDFLRLTLEQDDASEVTLAAEVDFVRRYLEIEQVRMGERLRVVIDVDADLLPAAVPALVLQPLVENAVKYAAAPRETGASIWVEARRDSGALVLSVSDDGPGMTSGDGVTGFGVGLANVRARVEERYGADGRMEVGASPSGGVCVRLQFPLHSVTREVAA